MTNLSRPHPFSILTPVELAARTVAELSRCMRSRAANIPLSTELTLFKEAASQLIILLDKGVDIPENPAILAAGRRALKEGAAILERGTLDEVEAIREALRSLRDAWPNG